MQLIDIHSHLLPGIDDGSDSWDMTLQMIHTSWDNGVRQIIATPHNLPWEEAHNTSRVRDLCQEAEERAREKLGIDIRIYPGQELYYHEETLADLEKQEALTLADSRYVLVEFAENVPYERLKGAIVRLTREGYDPIIAHFERFQCLRLGGTVEEIRALGARIQSNIHALSHYGRFSSGRRWLKGQYKQQTIDFIGSDMHNTTNRSPILPEDLIWYQKNLPEDYLERISYSNAQQILRSADA